MLFKPYRVRPAPASVPYPYRQSAPRRRPGRPLLGLVLAVVFSLSIQPALASSGGRGAYLEGLWSEARTRGIPRSLFDSAFAGFRINPKIIESAAKQPETAATVQDYVEKRVNGKRIEVGRAKLKEWQETLIRIERTYGVPAEILVAIWGIETNYGSFLGGSNVVHALATLAHENYRGSYFRSELLTALQIIRDGHIRSEEMVGSWAGAMGQTQFMPSSFMTYAVDFEGDGRADIWKSNPDALASSANYLSKNGWQHGETWGYEIRLPDGFDYASAWTADGMILADWQSRGVQRVDGKAFPRPSDPARLYLPAGGKGPAFLLLRNFSVIKRYNNSDSYALSIAHLADRISGAPTFASQWPQNASSLTQQERLELQTLLSARGFDVGTIDGRIGPKSRLALVRFQQRTGGIADAFPTKQILDALRRGAQDAGSE